MTKLMNLIVFVPLCLLFSLGALSGVIAIIFILMQGGGSNVVPVILFVSLFSWLAWLCGTRAYEAALAPASGQSGSGLKLVAFFFAGSVFLAALARPMFTGIVRKSTEGAAKGKLGAIRSALDHFKHDRGASPADISELTAGGKYLTVIPAARIPDYHEATAAVAVADKPNDAGGYFYDPKTGTIRINCTHTDTRGSSWDAY